MAANRSTSIQSDTPLYPIDSRFLQQTQQPTPASSPGENRIHVLAVDAQNRAWVQETFCTAVNRTSWQVPYGQLGQDTNPWTAVRDVLLERTGLAANQWVYLSSYVFADDDGPRTEHFFCATGVQADQPADDSDGHWIDLTELKRALVDGRIALASHATAVALALLHLS